MTIIEKLKNKDILIWGYGREGKSTERFIQNYCDVKSISLFEGAQQDIDENKYDLIIKSPGISVASLSGKYTSQTELFLEEFAKQTIGITGTKGKSTTSTMLFKVLSEVSPKKTFLVGNVGYPCLDFYQDIDADSIVVFEMSCHQLANIKVSPHIAVFLNLYEDHLDYYGTFENYFNAKKNITLYQDENDYFIYGDNVPYIQTKAKSFYIPFPTEQIFSLKLFGLHNQYNAHVVYHVCKHIYEFKDADILAEMGQFRGLPHRMEHIACVSGVDYYDDSISTIPEATIEAIQSIPKIKTILVGGMDRNINYDILINFIRSSRQYNFIFSYASGQRIFQEVSDLDNCYFVPDLHASVQLAKKITPNGTGCVLSPAAASYGYFKDFEDRGDHFKQYVLSQE